MVLFRIITIVLSIAFFLVSLIYLISNKQINTCQKKGIAKNHFGKFLLKIFYLIIGGVS